MLLRTQLLGYETERSEMERWKILHSAKDLDVGIATCIVLYVI